MSWYFRMILFNSVKLKTAIPSIRGDPPGSASLVNKAKGRSQHNNFWGHLDPRVYFFCHCFDMLVLQRPALFNAESCQKHSYGSSRRNFISSYHMLSAKPRPPREDSSSPFPIFCSALGHCDLHRKCVRGSQFMQAFAISHFSICACKYFTQHFVKKSGKRTEPSLRCALSRPHPSFSET